MRDLIDGLIASIAENSFDPFDFSPAFRGEIHREVINIAGMDNTDRTRLTTQQTSTNSLR